MKWFKIIACFVSCLFVYKLWTNKIKDDYLRRKKIERDTKER
jgi:hypothetical protein